MTIYNVNVYEADSSNKFKKVKNEFFKTPIVAHSYAAFCCKQLEKKKYWNQRESNQFDSFGDFVSVWFPPKGSTKPIMIITLETEVF